MRKMLINWNVRQFKRMFENGTISLEYPIQRAGNQWDLSQKSLLIHSLIEDFPVPALYAKVDSETNNDESTSIYYILDGKQRLTAIIDFVGGKYRLDKDTPGATVEGKLYEIANKTYCDLDEIVQDEIIAFSLQIYRLDDVTDEEIEEVFFRLNNGTSLSKQQKAKAKMGISWATKIKSLVDHPLMSKATFTNLQIRRAENEASILQAMMMIDDNYEWKGLSSNDVFDYAQTFKGSEGKDQIVSKVNVAMSYLDEAFCYKEEVLLRKINFPMMILTAIEAIERGVDSRQFYYWTMEFKKDLQGRSVIPTNYKEFSGAGSVGRKKSLGRAKEMKRHFLTYFSLLEDGAKYTHIV